MERTGNRELLEEEEEEREQENTENREQGGFVVNTLSLTAAHAH